MEWPKALSILLNVKYPVIQAPMLGVTSPEMVAAVSNSGGLGSLPVGGLSADKTRGLIQKVKQLTNKPFSVNLFAHDIPDFDVEEAEKMRSFLINLKGEYGLQAEIPELKSLTFYTYKEQIQVLIEENVSIVSFTFGVPDDASLSEMKNNGITLIGTATSVEEAILLEQKGVDAITLQGIEAGGHRGNFLGNDLPEVGLMALVSMTATKVKLPLIASGAINSGTTIKAAFALGAIGVQIGTAFIASNESLAIPAYKTALKTAKDTDMALTKSFSGRWARGIKNEFMLKAEESGITVPPYPIQNSLTSALRTEAQRLNDARLTNLWAGQAAASFAKETEAAKVFREIINDYEERFVRTVG